MRKTEGKRGGEIKREREKRSRDIGEREREREGEKSERVEAGWIYLPVVI